MVRDFVSFANRAATLMMSVTLARVYASYLYLLCFFYFFMGCTSVVGRVVFTTGRPGRLPGAQRRRKTSFFFRIFFLEKNLVFKQKKGRRGPKTDFRPGPVVR